MLVRTSLPLALALALALPAHAQQRQDEDDLVVTAERPRGSVPGDVTPEVTFSGADVRSFGANSIFQVLATLAPLTGSASIRGGGAPIVLVNGRRISGFQEIRDLPPDVISRVEVFDEQLSLQYGFSPDQRVVNLVLEETYRIDFLEAGAGAADGDAAAAPALKRGASISMAATAWLSPQRLKARAPLQRTNAASPRQPPAPTNAACARSRLIPIAGAPAPRSLARSTPSSPARPRCASSRTKRNHYSG